LLAGCGDKGIYEISTEKGATYILNRYTGAAYAVVGSTKTALSTEKESDEIRSPAKTLSVGKLPALPVEVSLRMRYVGDRFRYVVTISEASNSKNAGAMKAGISALTRAIEGNKEIGVITLKLQDDASFNVGKVIVELSHVTRLVGDDGSAMAYQAEGEQFMAYKTYNEIASIGALWNLKPVSEPVSDVPEPVTSPTPGLKF